jgi:3D (Asp-Asp-Asp) domain-containing protein
MAAIAAALALGCSPDAAPLRYPPVVVMSPFRHTGVVVRGASREWWKSKTRMVRYDDPLPVGVTMYCLKGTTRRGRYVRAGIVAADPRFFPLARFVELYVGRKYIGRFLVDDTGLRIVGARIDVWTPDCGEAERFGLQRGTAVLVHARELDVRQTGTVKVVK